MKRNYGLDLLKFICSFMVICIHAPFPGLMGNIIVPLARIAVPLFFMITGYYYSHTSERKKELKQIGKIFRLFVGANLLYFLFSLLKIFVNGESFAAFFSNTCSLKSVVKFVIFNESPFGVHLWYLGAILYVLLIVFLFEKKWNRKYLYPLIPFLLLMDLVLGKYSLLLLGKSLPYILVRNFLCVGLPYFLIGDMLYRYKTSIKSKNAILLSLLFACTTLTERYLLGTFNLNAVRDHYISTTFLSVFIFMSALQYEGNNQSKIIDKLSFAGAKLSTNIYILHPMFITAIAVLMNHLPDNKTFDTIYGYAAPFIIFIVSIIASLVLHKINEILSVRLSKTQNKK